MACLLLVLGPVRLVVAQDALEWTGPASISSPTEQGSFPTLTADSGGAVHAFWSSRPVGQESEPLAILYARYWDGEWTGPLDVLTSPDGGDALYARSLVDDIGRLHLVWSGSAAGPFGPLYHSWAPADDAMSARAWQPAVRIAEGTYRSDLAIDPEGRLHLVYASVGDAAGICHVLSQDHGDSWGPPSCIPRGYALRDQEAEVRPRLAIDSQGILHVVWMLDDYSALSQLAYSSRAVYYARSVDGGRSWTDVTPIDEVESRQEREGFQPDWGNVIVDREDRVHIVWVGSPDMHRYHQWSDDGGVTWTAPQVIIPTGGYNGWQGLAVDAGGALHVAWPSLEGLQYTNWDGNAWASPVLVDDRGGPHFAQAAVALGNQLHLVWQDYGGSLGPNEPGLIVHAMLEVDAPSIEPQPLPTPQAPVQPVATSFPTPVPAPTGGLPAAAVTLSIEPFAPASGSAVSPLIGLVPAVLLIGLVVLLRLRKT